MKITHTFEIPFDSYDLEKDIDQREKMFIKINHFLAKGGSLEQMRDRLIAMCTTYKQGSFCQERKGGKFWQRGFEAQIQDWWLYRKQIGFIEKIIIGEIKMPVKGPDIEPVKGLDS